MANMNNGTVTVTKSVRTFDFEDQKGVVIPGKIRCPKCGREVMGYPPYVQKRVYDQFGGSWKRYQEEWVCSACKGESKRATNAKLDEARRQQKLEEAKKLLEAEGYTVTKKK